MPRRIVTNKELAYIKSHYKTQSHKSIYDYLGMSKCFYHRLCEKHKFIRKNRIVAKANTETPKEVRYIKEHYLTTPQKQMARELKRSSNFVREVLSRHKIKIPKKIRLAFTKGSKFSADHVPANKGKKWSETHSKEGIANSQKTQFKKGTLPHNTRPIGIIITKKDKRGVPYKFKKLGHNNWMPLHRYNWIEANGPIPKGHIVVFKKGTTNCRLSNLKLISLEYNLFNNKHKGYPEELKETKFLLRKLNSKIKQHGS